MNAEEVNACDWCTFINVLGRVRCAMCRRSVRKRTRDLMNKHSQEISSLHQPSSENEREPVATLFSTAAGQPVCVSESSLSAAQKKMESEHDPGAVRTASTGGSGCDAVTTLFSTAAGQPVCVSESSLSAVRRRVMSSNENESLCGNGRGPVESGVCWGTHSPAVPRPSFEGPRQGRFVLPLARPSHERKSLHPTASRDTLSSEMRVKQGLYPLSFDLFLYSSLSISTLPSYEAILDGSFVFKGTGCSQDLLCLLGVTTEENVVVPRCFCTALLKLGATPVGCTEEWCKQMLRSTLLKLRGLSLHCSTPLPVFSVTHTLIYLCFKYNREFVDGCRPALRIVTEGDAPGSSLMVVCIVSLSITDRLAPHTGTGVISDGCYEIKISFDVPLTNLVREGVIRRGQKLLVCGAKMHLKNFCSPLDCRDDVVLSINYNCTRPVDSATALGFYHVDPPALPPATIHPLGGLVPSLRGTVVRVLPPIFIEQSVVEGGDKSGRENGGAARGGVKVVRNLLAQLKSHGRALQETERPSEAKNNHRLVRVSSLVLTCKDEEDVVLQLWEDCGEKYMLDSLEECTDALPAEGSKILVFAVTPSRGRPSHPFRNAKVVYTRGHLNYRLVAPPSGFVRFLQRGAEDMNPETPAGTPIDFGGFCVASARVDTVNSFLIVMIDTKGTKWTPSYCIMDIPCPTTMKEIVLAMPTVSFTPVIVQNSSFIRRADEDLGPDCLHVLANEFTHVLQRPASSPLRAILSVLEGIRDNVMATKSITARATELLRLRQLSDEARSDVCRLSCELVGSGDASAVMPSGRPSRVPYYMRSEKQWPISRGVIIPSAAAKCLPQSKGKTATPPLGLQHGDRSHVFGNIIGMRLLRTFNSGKIHSAELLEENFTAAIGGMVESPGLHEMPVQDSSRFEVDIQFGATAKECMTARIADPRVLSGMLEERVPIRSVCALTVDEGCVDYYVRRNKFLEDWHRTPEVIWWRLLTLSCVVPSDTPQLDTKVVMWLESEWRLLLEMIVGGVKNCLFKFSLEKTGEVARVVFIKDDCCLSDLMRE